MARDEHEVQYDKAGRAVHRLLCKEWSTGSTTICQTKLENIRGKFRNIFFFFTLLLVFINYTV